MSYFNTKGLLKGVRLEVAEVKARKLWWPVSDCTCADSFYEGENRTALLRVFFIFARRAPVTVYSDTSANEDNSFRNHIRYPKRDLP